MITIINSKIQPHHLPQFRQWLVAEWGDVDPFENIKSGLVVPPPILAVDDMQLLGGLAFTGYTAPDTENIGLWINAVLVQFEFRGMGIASQLIRAAELAAAGASEYRLHVRTNIPMMYLKLGWKMISVDGESSVLGKTLVKL